MNVLRLITRDDQHPCQNEWATVVGQGVEMWVSSPNPP